MVANLCWNSIKNKQIIILNWVDRFWWGVWLILLLLLILMQVVRWICCLLLGRLGRSMCRLCTILTRKLNKSVNYYHNFHSISKMLKIYPYPSQSHPHPSYNLVMLTVIPIRICLLLWLPISLEDLHCIRMYKLMVYEFLNRRLILMRILYHKWRIPDKLRSLIWGRMARLIFLLWWNRLIMTELLLLPGHAS